MAKMFRYIRSFGLVVVSAGLIFVLLLGSVVPAKAAPDKKTIKVGYRTHFTGAIATQTATFSSGALDCAKYQNDFKGGIGGIPIDILWQDAHCERVKEISIHKRFKAAEVVAEVTFLVNTRVIALLQQKDEIPLMNIAGFAPGGTTEPIRWVFGGPPYWCNLTATAINWFKEMRWSEAHPLRVGSVVYDDPAGRSSLEGVPEYCREIGAEWVGYEVVPFLGCIDTSTELLRIAAKKPDLIYTTLFGAPLVTVIKDSARLGLKDQGINFFGCANSVDLCIVRTTGAGDVQGWYTLTATPAPQEKFPAAAEILQAAQKYRGQGPEDVPQFYCGGWMGSLITFEGIRIALEKVGIENLNGRAVRDGLASIRDFDTGGILAWPANLSDEKPYIVDAVLVYQIQEGKIVRVGEPTPVITPAEMGQKM